MENYFNLIDCFYYMLLSNTVFNVVFGSKINNRLSVVDLSVSKQKDSL